MRIPMIAANWKMHKTVREANHFMEQLTVLPDQSAVEAVICPAFVHIQAISEISRRQGIRLGAQDMFWEASGAFTGEISPVMLKDLCVDYVIVGHSERRQLFGETDQQVAKKIKAAYQYDLTPILCVGETLQQRQAERTMDIISEQVASALTGLDPSHVRRMVIAYEPVWAIGSGLAATGRDANLVGEYIRKMIGEMFSLKVARDTRILYGGSVKNDNIREFMREPEIDGALIGGASLDPEHFAAMIRIAQTGVTL